MKKYLAAATGAALIIAAATFSQAQPTPPGTDRKTGEEGGTSANPNPDKSGKNQPNKNTGGKKASPMPTPPGTDNKTGDSSATSANPNPDKSGKNQPNKNGGGKKANPQPTPPGTDRPGGDSGGASANPKAK